MNVRSQTTPWPLLIVGILHGAGPWAAAQVTPDTLLASEDARAYLATIARQVEPSLKGRPARLPDYLVWFRQRMMNDTRLIALDAQTTVDAAGVVHVSGFTEYPETGRALRLFLETLGFAVVQDRLVQVPDGTIASRPFGLVTQSHCLCYADPDSDREVVTECLLGDPVFLLRETGHGSYWCHTAEGYLGYLPKSAVRRCDAAEFADWQAGPHLTMRVDHSLASGLTLPVGARLPAKQADPQGAECLLPTGETALVPSSSCRLSQREDANRIRRVINTARGLLKTPYLWGGKSSQGIDCSGLMQVAFAAESVFLPRDSNQQFQVGRLTATRWYRVGLRPGDALFFMGPLGKIRHTGIYLGDHQFLHATMPVVTIASFNSSHDNYDARRTRQFAFAKRLLD